MRNRLTFVWMALAALGLCVLASPAGAAEIAPKDLPEAVVKAIQAAHPGATIQEAEVETEDGKTTYEVEILKDKKEIDLEIAADGTILKTETEDADDEEVEEDDGDDDDDAQVDQDEDEDEDEDADDEEVEEDDGDDDDDAEVDEDDDGDEDENADDDADEDEEEDD